MNGSADATAMAMATQKVKDGKPFRGRRARHRRCRSFGDSFGGLFFDFSLALCPILRPSADRGDRV